ncbi:hypothetical protein [Flagellimonas hadalis]|uniref:Type II secretion system protein GspC N-terminal domain-containing protein n=1 Tax=Flagellimonas hadalis TaxID=2597517 RepID=A0A5N5IX94_9FLAO|nr:hypothetical protein [Allomuricauda hadalis]KAB5492149.1 hypothetical protein FOT42_004150 [Allomuricauda hadalis]
MSKNTKTYILLGLVLVIWGIIGYKLISAFSPDPEPVTFMETTNFKSKNRAQKDTFSLLANYRDPFLGTWNTSRPKKKQGAPVKKESIEFPNIIYTGLVSGAHTKDHIYFVTIGGSQYLMKRGTQQNGVTLVSGTSKNIRVAYKGVVKTVTLANETP